MSRCLFVFLYSVIHLCMFYLLFFLSQSYDISKSRYHKVTITQSSISQSHGHNVIQYLREKSCHILKQIRSLLKYFCLVEFFFFKSPFLCLLPRQVHLKYKIWHFIRILHLFLLPFFFFFNRCDQKEDPEPEKQRWFVSVKTDFAFFKSHCFSMLVYLKPMRCWHWHKLSDIKIL